MSEPSTHTATSLQHIAILGGGTAGWMTANLLAHRWAHRGVSVTLVESPHIGIIGVGEGSTPTLARLFRDLGIPDEEWMPVCKATYKVNIRFDGWSPGMGVSNYSHPFISQLDVFTERAFHVNCRTRRLGLDVTTSPDRFLFNGWLAKKGLSPCTPENFPFRIEYGYHFDSGLLGEFLKRKAIARGVTHVELDVDGVSQHDDGRIKSLIGLNGEEVNADFFIDCSGFRALLIQQTLGVPFESFASNLFNDAAVAMPSARDEQLPVETGASALSAGWAWRIPLTHRTGNGYVYSTAYMTPDAAETELRAQLGLLDADVEARHLKMKVGQVREHWHKNCLALGLSQGFIEPLEATALHLVQTSAEIFMDYYEDGGFTDTKRDAYNTVIHERFERVRDYIVAHYKLNTRDDTQYWRDNRNNMQLSESLKQLLDVWYRGGDLTAEVQRQDLNSHFGATSWHCLFAGYGQFPPPAARQPGEGDLFVTHEISKLFTGCLLNFRKQKDSIGL